MFADLRGGSAIQRQRNMPIFIMSWRVIRHSMPSSSLLYHFHFSLLMIHLAALLPSLHAITLCFLLPVLRRSFLLIAFDNNGLHTRA